jgi:hypothetical protein
MFNIAQSFFIDKELVQGSPLTFVTSIDLYFKSKPVAGKTYSGIQKPGMLLNICAIVDGKPTTQLVDHRCRSRMEYDDINVSSTASVPTKFTLSTPLPLSTDKEYAIIISYDGNDPGFVLWKNTSGEQDLSTGSMAKVSTGKVDGNYFDLTNGTDITRRNDVDLKFKVNVARFTGSRSNTFVISNDAYEFMSLNSGSVNGSFVGGEYVYQAQANLTGTVSVSSGTPNVAGVGTDFVTDIANGDLIVVGNSSVSQVRKVNVVTNTTYMNVTSNFSTTASGVNITTFEHGTLSIDSNSNTVIGTGTSFASVAVGSFIVITDGTDGNTEVRKIVSVDIPNQTLVLDVKPSFSNTSSAWFVSPIGKVEKFRNYADNLVLNSSSANSTVYFETNRILKGVDFHANAVISSINDLPLASYKPDYSIGVPTGTSVKYFVNFANTTYSKLESNKVEVKNGTTNVIDNYPASLASRSNEVTNPSNLFANSKSMNSTLVFSSDNPFTSPYVSENNLDFVTYEYLINNSSANEAFANGSAYTRYISKTVTLEKDQIAEDLIVYLTAFKPQSTDIRVYTKLLSEEDNDYITDKNWTRMLLDVPEGSQINSVESNPKDLIELKYVIPQWHSGTTVSSGTFRVATSTNVITSTSSTVNTSIAVGSLVRVYNPNFPDTFFVDTVVASNTTTFTVSETVSNNDVVGAGLLVDVINDQKYSAYLNNQNYNIVRYMNSSSAKYDGFKSFAIKIVLLAENYYLVPRVSEYRAIALSA